MRKLEEEKKIKKEFNLLLRKNKGTNQLFEQIYNFYYYGRYTENSSLLVTIFPLLSR